MVDTVRTLAALQTLLADNTAGDVSANDLRDMLVSTFPTQFLGGMATRASTNQTITNNSVTAISFDTEVHDTDSIIDVAGANPEQLNVNTVGYYAIKGGCYFASSATNIRAIYVRKNGSDIIAAHHTIGTSVTFASVSVDDYASVLTDYYEILVYQDSGGNLDLVASARNFGAIAFLGQAPA